MTSCLATPPLYHPSTTGAHAFGFGNRVELYQSSSFASLFGNGALANTPQLDKRRGLWQCLAVRECRCQSNGQFSRPLPPIRSSRTRSQHPLKTSDFETRFEKRRTNHSSTEQALHPAPRSDSFMSLSTGRSLIWLVEQKGQVIDWSHLPESPLTFSWRTEGVGMSD